MKIEELRVGDKVQYSDVNRKELITTTVEKITKKYIYCGHRLTFDRDSLGGAGSYGSNYKLIIDLDVYKEEQEAIRLYGILREMLHGYTYSTTKNYTAKQLSQCINILSGTNDHEQ